MVKIVVIRDIDNIYETAIINKYIYTIFYFVRFKLKIHNTPLFFLFNKYVYVSYIVYCVVISL